MGGQPFWGLRSFKKEVITDNMASLGFSDVAMARIFSNGMLVLDGGVVCDVIGIGAVVGGENASASVYWPGC